MNMVDKNIRINMRKAMMAFIKELNHFNDADHVDIYTNNELIDSIIDILNKEKIRMKNITKK